MNVIWAAALKVTDLFIIYWLHPKFWCGSWMSLLYMYGHILCSELVNYASVKPCSSSLPQSVIIIPTASLKHVDWKQNIKLPPDWPGESPLTNLTASSGCECNIDSKWILHARTVPASFLFQISADIRSVLFSLASGRLKLHVWLHACCVRTFVSCILAQPHFFFKKKQLCIWAPDSVCDDADALSGVGCQISSSALDLDSDVFSSRKLVTQN